MGFPHAALKGQGRPDCSPGGGLGVWASRTHSSEFCLHQAEGDAGRRVWGSLVWRVQFSSRAQKYPFLPSQPCSPPLTPASLVGPRGRSGPGDSL